MTVKEFLSQYIEAEREIEALKSEQRSLQERAESCTSALSGERKRSASGDTLSYLVSKIADIDKQIEREIEGLKRKRQNVVSVISRIKNGKIRTLMRRRYLAGRKWEEIAEGMKYDLRWVYRMHGKGLAITQRILDERDKNTPC